MIQEILIVEKESITNCTFNKETEIVQQKDLLKKIQNATILGNTHHSKVSIIFQDDDSVKRVDTTIWAAGPNSYALKAVYGSQLIELLKF